MTATRRQHAVFAAIVLAVAAVVAWISFTREPAEAFLFPRLISTFFAVLAVWNFIRAVSGMARVGVGLPPSVARNILPGLVVMVLFVLVAAKGLGFYAASTIAFLAILAIYDPADPRDSATWIRRLAVTLVFMAAIHGLFALLLRVQTPRGLLF